MNGYVWDLKKKNFLHIIKRRTVVSYAQLIPIFPYQNYTVYITIQFIFLIYSFSYSHIFSHMGWASNSFLCTMLHILFLQERSQIEPKAHLQGSEKEPFISPSWSSSLCCNTSHSSYVFLSQPHIIRITVSTEIV